MKISIGLIILLALFSCNQRVEDLELCGMGIVKPYYVTGLQYKGEIYEIEKEIRGKFVPVKSNNTGIARVRFKVNCEGELGDIHYEEYNMEYVKTPLNDSIEMQLVKTVSQLSDWIPGVDDNGNEINSHSFLAFRIVNGEIVEILPK